MFAGAKTQYIDGDGKTRAITFRTARGEVTILTSPIPPLNIPFDKKIVSTNVEGAKELAKKLNLTLVSQKVVNDELVGINFYSQLQGLYAIYIPIIPSKPLENVELSSDPVPLIPPTENRLSKLEAFRRNRKMAEILKQYVLFTYARDPTKWSDKSIVVVPDHVYDIPALYKRIFYDDNRVIYDAKGRIIVPSEETKTRLLDYLKTSLYNDRPGVEMKSEPGPIEGYYRSVSDFRPSPSQLIFVDRASVKGWIKSRVSETLASTVSRNLLPASTTPYFYRSSKFKDVNTIFLIQNVENGDLESAVSVSYRWFHERINDGYNPPISPKIDEIAYTIYHVSGTTQKVRDGEESVPILDYGDQYYAAILFL